MDLSFIATRVSNTHPSRRGLLLGIRPPIRRNRRADQNEYKTRREGECRASWLYVWRRNDRRGRCVNRVLVRNNHQDHEWPILIHVKVEDRGSNEIAIRFEAMDLATGLVSSPGVRSSTFNVDMGITEAYKYRNKFAFVYNCHCTTRVTDAF